MAIFGISRRETSLGKTIFEKLTTTGFQGEVYPIHPQMQSIGNVAVWSSLAEISKPIDLALVVLPRDKVFEALEACGEKGVKCVVLISAGFSEVGDIKREKKVRDLAGRFGMTLVGPNCMGVINTDAAIRLNATFSPVFPLSGGVGVISQSGSLGQVLLEYCDTLGLGISKFASMGNQADLEESAMIAYLAADKPTRLILLYLEKISNPVQFISAARRCKKPMVALLGCSQSKQKNILKNICKRAGVIAAENLSDWFGVASLLYLQPKPKGVRLGILTNAGGPAMLAAQQALAKKLKLPPWRPALVRTLREFLPAAAIVQNPLDILATATAQDYEKSLGLLLQEPSLDAILVIFVTPAQRDAAQVVRSILPVIERAGRQKTVVCCFLMGKGRGRLLKAFGETHLPIFSFPEEAIAALAAAAN